MQNSTLVSGLNFLLQLRYQGELCRALFFLVGWTYTLRACVNANAPLLWPIEYFEQWSSWETMVRWWKTLLHRMAVWFSDGTVSELGASRQLINSLRAPVVRLETWFDYSQYKQNLKIIVVYLIYHLVASPYLKSDTIDQHVTQRGYPEWRAYRPSDTGRVDSRHQKPDWTCHSRPGGS